MSRDDDNARPARGQPSPALALALEAADRLLAVLETQAEALLPDLPDDERDEAARWLASVRAKRSNQG